MPAENGCVPPPSLATGQEQSPLGCPPCKDPGKRAACSIKESARPPTKRIGLGSNRPYWEDLVAPARLIFRLACRRLWRS